MVLLSAQPSSNADAIVSQARQLVHAQAQAVLGLAAQLNQGFVQALQLMLACEGRVVVCGLGKTGLVGQKISATLASTGTPSLFVHAAEALHGDLGRITGTDVVLALSNSGESAEIVRLVQPVKDLGAALVVITGDEKSRLARHADAVIGTGPIVEACPMGLVPTASTTAMMVLGDTLAMCLFNQRRLGPQDYARLHPAGQLGRQLLRVREVMRQGNENPLVGKDTAVRDVIAVMTETPGRPGAASIVDAHNKLLGFFTDGDLRRLLRGQDAFLDGPIGHVMHATPKQIGPEHWVADAVRTMRQHKIDQLPVVDDDGHVVGLLDVQDILSSRP